MLFRSPSCQFCGQLHRTCRGACFPANQPAAFRCPCNSRRKRCMCMCIAVFTENFGMTFAKKGHARVPEFAGMEVNQHPGNTLATHFHSVTSFGRKPNTIPYIICRLRFRHLNLISKSSTFNYSHLVQVDASRRPATNTTRRPERLVWLLCSSSR